MSTNSIAAFLGGARRRTPDDDVRERLFRSVLGQESSGGRNEPNPDSGALGIGQVMPANVRAWSKKHLGREISPEEFASRPDWQETIVRGQLGEYFDGALKRSAGDVDRAVRMTGAMWYGGPDDVDSFDDDAPRFTNGKEYPSFRKYTTDLLGRFKGGQAPAAVRASTRTPKGQAGDPVANFLGAAPNPPSLPPTSAGGYPGAAEPPAAASRASGPRATPAPRPTPPAPAWSIAQLPDVEGFYRQTFGRDLPISARGQSRTHNRMKLDHSNSVDVALNPESAEGKALIAHLNERGIPHLAFTHAVPGQATGPHIHIGERSHRLGNSKSSTAAAPAKGGRSAVSAFLGGQPSAAPGASAAPELTPGPQGPADWTEEEEADFQSWYRELAPAYQLDPNPDAPEHHYDYRSAFRAGALPDPATGHWPSEFKAADHPRRYGLIGGKVVDTTTGQEAPAGTEPDFVEGEDVPQSGEARRRNQRKLHQKARKRLLRPQDLTAAQALMTPAGLIGAFFDGGAKQPQQQPPTQKGREVRVQVGRDSLGRPRIKGPRGETYVLNPHGGFRVASDPERSTEELRLQAGRDEYKRQLDRDREAARLSGDSDAMAAEFAAREKQLEFMNGQLEAAIVKRVRAQEALQKSDKKGRVTHRDLEGQIAANRAHDEPTYGGLLDRFGAIAREEGDQTIRAGSPWAVGTGFNAADPGKGFNGQPPSSIRDSRLAILGQANRLATRDLEDHFGIDPYSGDRGLTGRLADILRTFPMGQGEGLAQTAEGAGTIVPRAGSAIASGLRTLPFGQGEGLATTTESAANALGGLGSYVPTNPIEAGSSFVAGLTGVESRDPWTDVRFLALSPRAREEALRRRADTDLVPQLAGGSLPYFALPLLGPFAESGAAAIGAARAEAAYYGNPAGSEGAYSSALGDDQADAQLSGRMTSEAISQALQAVLGRTGGHIAASKTSGFSPGTREAIIRLAGAGGSMSQQVIEDLKTNLELHGTNWSKWEAGGKRAYFLAGLMGVALESGGRPQPIYLQDATGRTGEIGVFGHTRVVDPSEVRAGSPVLEFASVAPEGVSFDAVFSPEGGERPGMRSEIYGNVRSDRAELATPFRPDLERVVSDPDAYRESLLSQARAAETLRRVAAGEHFAESPDVTQRIVAEATAAGERFPGLLDLDEAGLAQHALALRRGAGGVDEALLSPSIAGRFREGVEARAGELEGRAADARTAADEGAASIRLADEGVAAAERGAADARARREAAEAQLAQTRAAVQAVVARGGQVDMGTVEVASQIARELQQSRAAEVDAARALEAAKGEANAARANHGDLEAAAKLAERATGDVAGLRKRGDLAVERATKALAGRRAFEARQIADPATRAKIEAEVRGELEQVARRSGMSEQGLGAAARVVVNVADRLGSLPGVDPEATLAQRLAAVTEAITGEQGVGRLFRAGSDEGSPLAEGDAAVFDSRSGGIFLGQDATALDVAHELLHAIRLRGLLDPAVDSALTGWARAYYAANRDDVLAANPRLRDAGLSEEQLERRGIEEVLAGALERVLTDGRLPSGAKAVEGAFADLAAIGREIYEPVFSSHLVDGASIPADVRRVFEGLVGSDLVNASERVLDLDAGTWKAAGSDVVGRVELDEAETKRLFEIGEQMHSGRYKEARPEIERLARDLGTTVREAESYLEALYADFRRQTAGAAPGETVRLEARMPRPVPGDAPELVTLKGVLRSAANNVFRTKAGWLGAKNADMAGLDRELQSALSPVLGRAATIADVNEYLVSTMPPEWFERAAAVAPEHAARYSALAATKATRAREAAERALAAGSAPESAPAPAAPILPRRDWSGVPSRLRPKGDDPAAFDEGLGAGDLAREADHARTQARAAEKSFRKVSSAEGPHTAKARALYDAARFWRARESAARERSGETRRSRGRRAQPAAQVLGGAAAPESVASSSPAVSPSGSTTAGGAVAEEAPLPPEKFASTGRGARVKTAAGTQVDVEYAIVDRGSLTTSHDRTGAENPAFPAELQPRDRTRIASEEQVKKIAGELDPEQVGESYLADSGAPIIGRDGLVESGNGRVLGLEEAYANVPESAARYREWLKANAERFGLDPAAVDSLERPVLVRVRRSPVDRARFAKEANERTSGEMSAAERAQADARVLSPELMATFRPGESGEIGADSNTEFVRSFIRAAVPESELARYVTADGQISREGVTRIQNAIIARAYGAADAVEALAESTDSNVRNILAGMTQAAPRVAQVRDVAAERGLDIGPEISSAMQKLSSLRAQGMSVADYLAQGDMFGGGLSPIARDVLVEFDANARSPRRIRATLEAYADALDALGDPRQASMFGPPPDVSKTDLLTAALERAREVEPDAEGQFQSGGLAAPRDAADVGGTRGAAALRTAAPAPTGRAVETASGASVPRGSEAEVAPAPASSPARQAYAAGDNRGAVEFVDRTHRDLYNLGAELRRRMRGGQNKSSERPNRDIAALRRPLAETLGLSDGEVDVLAIDTHTDVRAQMRGFADGETRRVVDNVRSAAPERATLDTESEAPDGRPARSTDARNDGREPASRLGAGRPDAATLPRETRARGLRELTADDVDVAPERLSRRANAQLDRFVAESKAVRPDGDPLLLAHGTPRTEPITSFDPERTSRSIIHGSFWTADPGLAENYATKGGGEGQVYTGVMRAERPFEFESGHAYPALREIDADAGRLAADWADVADAETPIPGKVFWSALNSTVADRLGITIDGNTSAADRERVVAAATKALREAGFDSARYKFGVGEFAGSDVWVAFDADQIRTTGHEMFAGPARSDVATIAPDPTRGELGQWLSGSRLVDPDGAPSVLFRDGEHFTRTPTEDGPYYVRARLPFDPTDPGHADALEAFVPGDLVDVLRDGDPEYWADEDLQRAAAAAGFDGAITKDGAVVFDESQARRLEPETIEGPTAETLNALERGTPPAGDLGLFAKDSTALGARVADMLDRRATVREGRITSEMLADALGVETVPAGFVRAINREARRDPGAFLGAMMDVAGGWEIRTTADPVHGWRGRSSSRVAVREEAGLAATRRLLGFDNSTLPAESLRAWLAGREAAVAGWRPSAVALAERQTSDVAAQRLRQIAETRLESALAGELGRRLATAGAGFADRAVYNERYRESMQPDLAARAERRSARDPLAASTDTDRSVMEAVLGHWLWERARTLDEAGEDNGALVLASPSRTGTDRATTATTQEAERLGVWKRLGGLIAESPSAALGTVGDFTKANKLTNPATHLTNVTSNSLEAMRGEVSDMGASVLDIFVAKGLGGVGLGTNKRSRTWSPLNTMDALGVTFSWKGRDVSTLSRAELRELHKGGLRQMLEAVQLKPKAKKGYRLEGREQLEFDSMADEVEYNRLGIPKLTDKSLAGIVDRYNSHIFSLLEAEDAIFYTFALQKALGDVAMARAMNEGLRGREAWTRRNELIGDPPQDMLDLAEADASQRTFKNSTTPAQVVTAVRSALQKAPRVGPALKLAADLIVPFSQTPSSILVKGFDLAGGAYFRAGSDYLLAKKLIREGALDDFDKMPEVMALQRSMTGHLADAITGSAMITIAALTGALAGAAGIIVPTVSADDRDATGKMTAQGLGYTGGRIIIGGHTFDLANVGPMGTALLLAAAAGQGYRRTGTWGGIEDTGWQAFNLLREHPLMSGFSDTIAMGGKSVDDEDAAYKRRRFAASQLSSFIPGSSLVGAIARSRDVDRKTSTVTDMVKAGIPGLREDLPEKRNVYTGKVEEGRGLLNFAPFSPQKYRGDNPAVRLAVDWDLVPFTPDQRKSESDAQYKRRLEVSRDAWRQAVGTYAGQYKKRPESEGAYKRRRAELTAKIRAYVDARVDALFPQ